MRFGAMATLAAAAVYIGGQSAVAYGNPPKFPDIDRYTPVDFDDYAIDTTTPGMPSSGVYFRTPDGIICNFTLEQAQCVGNNFPAVPPLKTDPSRGLNGSNWIGTWTKLKPTSGSGFPDGIVHDQPVKTLPPMHSIAFYGMICGVDDARTTACKDSKGRGFILSPAWSGWLPKV